MAGRQPGVGGGALVRRVRGPRLADPALLHLPRPRLRRPGTRSPLHAWAAVPDGGVTRGRSTFEYTSHPQPGRLRAGPGRRGRRRGRSPRCQPGVPDRRRSGQGPRRRDTRDRLASRVAGRWHEVIQHVPVELAERARAAVTEAGADAVVCLGGGSSTGLAKAIALSHEYRSSPCRRRMPAAR